jgi:hypothetical protein
MNLAASHVARRWRTLVGVTTWLAAAETRASTSGTTRAGQHTSSAELQQTKWFHAYHEGDTDTACGRPLDGLTPSREAFLGRPSHCPRCDALTTTGAVIPPDVDD